MCLWRGPDSCGVEETEVRLLVGPMQGPLCFIRTQEGTALQSGGDKEGLTVADISHILSGQVCCFFSPAVGTPALLEVGDLCKPFYKLGTLQALL